VIGKVAKRREARVETILAAAWDLAQREGIAGLTLRGLARDLGLSQPSLYEYFGSKHELYDALFDDGNRQLLERLDAVRLTADPRHAVKAFMRAFTEFALENDARQQLLFQRPIPGFEPSPASYGRAEQVLARAIGLLEAAGLHDPGDIDCFVAMVAGLIDAQASNDPGGTRWTRHLDRLIDLYLDNPRPRRTR
jgi:AcrR family transcriptional regulator